MRMTELKLKPNYLMGAFGCADAARAMITTLYRDEKLAPINVHSHGNLIKAAILELETARNELMAFQLQVQGR